MARWCLLKEKADILLDKLKSKELSYGGLRKMSSEDRLSAFKGFMSERDAKRANILFEQKLLQKDFFRAMDSWTATLTGKRSSRAEAIRKDVAKRKAESLKRIFSPSENQSFLSELAEQKVGIGLTRDEADVVFKLSKEIANGENAFDKKYIKGIIESARGKSFDAETGKLLDSMFEKLKEAEISGRTKKFLASNAWRDLRRTMEEGIPQKAKDKVNFQIDKVLKERNSKTYGESRAELEKIIGDLKLSAEGSYSGDYKKGGIQGYRNLTKRAIIDSFSLMKAMKGSVDISAVGRQGLPILTSGHPKEWLKLVANQAKILKKAKGGDVLKTLRSEINNRPNGRNGLYDRMNIAVGGREEQFNSTIADKIPIVRESAEMFTGSLWMARADLADKLYLQTINDWKKLGTDLTKSKNSKLLDKELKRLGRRINSMTGRGDIGLGKMGTVTQTALWSPKFVQSNLDKLTGHFFDSDMMKSTVQRKALLKEWSLRIGLTAGAMGIASMLVKDKDSVEWNTTSSKFGTVKGIDVTGGLGGYITLLSRAGSIFSNSVAGTNLGIKNASTGIVETAGGYKNGLVSILSDFVAGKSSPGTRFILDLAEGYNFKGESMKWDSENPERTILIWTKGTLAPIPIENYMKSLEKNDGDALKAFNLAMLADLAGFSDKNGVYTMSWEKSQSKEMLQFREKVGSEKFLQANKEFAKEMQKSIPKFVEDERFKKLDEKKKKSKIDKLNTATRNKIFEKYGFEYEKEDVVSEDNDYEEYADEAIAELIGE